MLLALNDVTIRYGTVEAIRDVSICVEEGSVVSVIGANGAGKSTILKAIAGQVGVSLGSIKFLENNIDELPMDQRVKLGVACVPEGRHLFPYMTVAENIKLGAYTRRDREGIKADLLEVLALFPRCRERLRQSAGRLSGGEQQMVAIARALMARPRLLMMDEPSLGLAPMIINELATIIRNINARGVSVLLVEQNAGLVTKVSQKAYVLEIGRVVAEGPMRELMANDLVRKAFVG